jgi:hypothetical protein
MNPQNLRYILTRAATVILLIVAILYGIGMLKKKQRKDAIISDLKSVCSDSFFFRQFHTEDARKTLVRGIGLIAEAKQLGMDPDESIDGGLGIKEKYFTVDDHDAAPPIKERIIRSCLRANYENFLKLGYTPDFHTLQGMKTGKLPPVRTGPSVGSRAEIGTIIDAALSPGLDCVVANLEIRPPRKTGLAMNDVEIATAKQLAKDLSDAGVIETAAADRIIESLTQKPLLHLSPEEEGAFRLDDADRNK